MTELIDLKELEERVILVGVSQGDGSDAEQSLTELEELVKTAGAVTAGKVIQRREQAHPGTYLGKGKLEEVKELLWDCLLYTSIRKLCELLFNLVDTGSPFSL